MKKVRVGKRAGSSRRKKIVIKKSDATPQGQVTKNCHVEGTKVEEQPEDDIHVQCNSDAVTAADSPSTEANNVAQKRQASEDATLLTPSANDGDIGPCAGFDEGLTPSGDGHLGTDSLSQEAAPTPLSPTPEFVADEDKNSSHLDDVAASSPTTGDAVLCDATEPQRTDPVDPELFSGDSSLHEIGTINLATDGKKELGGKGDSDEDAGNY